MSAAMVLARSVRAEGVRLGGGRGLLLRVALPLGLGLPVVVTLAVAVVAEKLHGADSLLQVRQVPTSNSVYWLVYLGVTVFAVVAAYAQGTAVRGPAAEVARHGAPRPFTGMLGRWILIGVVSAFGMVLCAFLLMVALPALFPGVYGQVDAASADGVRLLWALPVYAFLAAGIGVAVGALVPWPAAAVAVLTLWALFIENAAVMLPRGGDLIGWMPFLNGVYASGQDIALSPSWGRDGALAYVALVTAALLAAGWARLRRERAR
ncbi:hypothetical protein [Tomitella gaofuii]|uniref:hypothetical protein n=1 Tax=Tomitella gaofuii TaxID=2760083 RepID=UPI002E29DBF8|nr:hypothetical protein [Tomitella gaofuii]